MVKTLSLDDDQLVSILNNSGVGVLPSDTVYGLVCRALDPAAVTKLYALKLREHKPGTVIAANTQQLEELGLEHTEIAQSSNFWPGPTSVLIVAPESLRHVTQDKPELACRVVSGPPALISLLLNAGPLLTTSANEPDMPTAETIEQARKYFGDSVDFYVDAGFITGGMPSTLIRINDGSVEVLRQGAATIPTQEEMK